MMEGNRRTCRFGTTHPMDNLDDADKNGQAILGGGRGIILLLFGF
jgi:hypothetical protein